MNEIELLHHRLKLTQKEIKQSIEFSYEDDECTECYAQGLIDALAMCEWLFNTIEDVYKTDQQEQKLTSNAEPSEGQMELFQL